MSTQVPISEAQLKKAIDDLLQYQANLGHLVYLRLNAGSFILQNSNGSYRRRVQGVGKGTSDFVVFQGVEHSVNYQGQRYKPIVPMLSCRVTFIEIKSSKGKQSLEQIEFQEQVEKLHCRYFLVRDAEELEDRLRL